jgi:tetratricopeptide (TPR) repeat protein
MRFGVTTLLCALLISSAVVAQSGGHVLIGDIKVDESNAGGSTIATFQVLLYNESGSLIMRQTVSSNGRYRFMDLRNGRYEVAVEYETREIARVLVTVQSPFRTDFRKDIELQWSSPRDNAKTGVVSVSDYYNRSAANKHLFRHAKEASEKKHYEEAVAELRQIVDADDRDFPAWEELGTNFFILKSFFEAESCYFKAVQLRPDYLPALINLGRVRIVAKNFAGAIEALDRAVKLQPRSAPANYFLGEAYLQAKLGSKGVVYLNEAIKLDPVAMADAHLLLAALYNAKGLKQKAAAEYSAFLQRRPDYPDRKKLETFISTNKTPD